MGGPSLYSMLALPVVASLLFYAALRSDRVVQRNRLPDHLQGACVLLRAAAAVRTHASMSPACFDYHKDLVRKSDVTLCDVMRFG